MANFYDVYDLITEDDVYVKLSPLVIQYIAADLGFRGFSIDLDARQEYLESIGAPVLDENEYYDFVGLCVELDNFSESIPGGGFDSNYFWDKRQVSEIVRFEDGIGLYIEK